MKKHFIILVLYILASLIQFSHLYGEIFSFIRADIIFILTLIIAFKYTSLEAISWAFVAGMIIGAFNPQARGIYSIVYMISAYFINSISSVFTQDHPVSVMLVTLIGSLIKAILIPISLSIKMGEMFFTWTYIKNVAILEIVFNVIFSFFVFIAINKFLVDEEAL